MADKMAKCYMCLLRLIILGSFLKGTSGVNETHVLCSSGETVSLPCNNALSDCTSTTWNYNKYRGSKTDELIAGGKTKNDTDRRERLSLGSDCSLNIQKVTKEDFGSYSCEQYENGQQQGTHARVYLHVFHVTSSSSQTDIKLGSSLTLYCQLQSYNQFPCDTLVRTENLQLIWVNQDGDSVMTDSRYQISSRDCISSLTTLLNEDQNREWRCQVTLGNQLKTSDTFTVKSLDEDDPTTPVTNSEDNSTTNMSTSHEREIVISTVVAALAVILVAAFWLIYKKRRDDKKRTHSSVVKDVNEHKATYETINMPNPSMPNVKEETDDVTYSEVTSSHKKQVQMNNDHSNDTVTYAAIRTTPPNDELYTSVEKEKKNTPHK